MTQKTKKLLHFFLFMCGTRLKHDTARVSRGYIVQFCQCAYTFKKIRLIIFMRWGSPKWVTNLSNRTEHLSLWLFQLSELNFDKVYRAGFIHSITETLDFHSTTDDNGKAKKDVFLLFVHVTYTSQATSGLIYAKLIYVSLRFARWLHHRIAWKKRTERL